MRVVILMAALLIFSCKIKQPGAKPADKFIPDFTKGPPTIVYKTKKEYRNLVPVLLSEDKSRIIAYPGKGDISGETGFPIPLVLHRNYYLDNRGITKDGAFLNLTYAEYSKLSTIPSTADMYKMIVDKDPFIEFCDCGSRKAFKDIEKQLNKLIDSGMLREKCRVLK